jgi:hypothetical protein
MKIELTNEETSFLLDLLTLHMEGLSQLDLSATEILYEYHLASNINESIKKQIQRLED